MEKFLQELRRDLREEARRMCGGPGLDADRIYPDNPLCLKALCAAVRDVWTPRDLRERAARALGLLGHGEDARVAEAECRAKIASYRHSAAAGEDVSNPYVRALRDYARQKRREADVKRMIERMIRRELVVRRRRP